MITRGIVIATTASVLLAGAGFAPEVYDIGKEFGRGTQGRGFVSVPVLTKSEYTVNAVSVKDEIPTHRHDADNHVLYIVSGQGTVTVAGSPAPLRPGMLINIPKGVEHGIRAERSELRLVDFAEHARGGK